MQDLKILFYVCIPRLLSPTYPFSSSSPPSSPITPPLPNLSVPLPLHPFTPMLLLPPLCTHVSDSLMLVRPVLRSAFISVMGVMPSLYLMSAASFCLVLRTERRVVISSSS